jgi:hypothetical protein
MLEKYKIVLICHGHKLLDLTNVSFIYTARIYEYTSVKSVKM